MGKGPQKYEIRASYDERNIAVYAAFDSHIADVAIQQQKLLPPFLLDRMTWIKPSFLWLMYRSEWGTRAGMGRVLQIWIDRKAWEGALREAVLTTPEPHVYPDAKKWRKQLERARVRVQWDPERDLRNVRQDYKSIQVGITPALTGDYAKKWIRRIEDKTDLVQRVGALVAQGKHREAEALLPAERPYVVDAGIRKALGMTE